MQTIKRFVWFTRHSWKYQQGQRLNYFTGFVRAWRRFDWLEKHDATHYPDHE